LPRPRILSALALRPLGVAATFLAVCVGWVFFRAQSLGDAGTLLSRMFAPAGGTALDLPTTLIAAGCLAVLLAGHLVGTFVDLKRAERRAPAAVLGAGLAGLLLAVLFLMPVNAKGFIYFQF
jgi:alginate O-acetyltransferase complex protein AlgI